MVAALTRTNPLHEQNMRIVLMEACLALGRWEDTLAQLAQRCDPPITKSALNHRLRKLVELGRADL